MKRNWLRGLLLGVSLALLLGGGVALSASLTLSVDRECVECWPGPGDPTGEYVFTITLRDFNPTYLFCNWWTLAGEEYAPEHCWPVMSDPLVAPYYVPCGGWPELIGAASAEGMELGSTVANADGAPYGEMVIRGWQVETGESDEITWLYAEDCSAYEFVPEPGSIFLLGSGLAGLAGYATLRWRTRE